MPLKGDLQSVHLGDIFQTLAANRQEGVLVVTRANRVKRVYFKEGRIALLASVNRRGFRLGDRLISLGKLTPTQLQQALLRHEHTGAPLGEVLVELGYVTRGDVEETLRFQAEEEIYELFTWKDAEFEFHEGPPPPDPSQNRDMARIFFNVAHIVMEAARREDEWAVIRREIPDLGEIFVVAEGAADLEEVDWLTRRVLAHMDGRRNVTQLAECTGYSTFDLAKILWELLQAGRIRPATPAELEAAYRELLRAREYDRALPVLERLLRRAADPEPYLEEAVRVSYEAGRFEEGSGYALELAARLEGRGDLAGAEKVLRRAGRLDLRHVELQDRLLAVLGRRRAWDAYVQHALHVADLALKGGEADRARAVLEEAARHRPGDFRVLERLTEVLVRCGRREEALSRLDSVLSTLDPGRDRRRVELVAERMLRLGSRDPRVERLLAEARRSRRASVRRRVAIFSTLVPALLLTGHLLERHRLRREAQSLLLEAHEAEAAGELWRARALLDRVLAAAPGEDLLREARERRRQVAERLHAQLAALEAAKERENRRLLARARERMEAGAYTEALAEYRKLAARSPRGRWHETARRGIRELGRRLAEAVARLGRARAALHRAGTGPEAVAARLARYERLLRDPLRDEAERLYRRLEALAGAEPLRREVEALRAPAGKLVAAFAALARERRAHLEILRREKLYRYVNAEWLAAHAAFRRGELQAARRHLMNIVRSRYRAEPLPEIQTFLAEVNRILELSRRSQRPQELGELAQLFARIQDTLRRYPQLEGVVKLPLRIQVDPPGAAIYLDGRLVGHADPSLTLTYRRGTKSMVRVECPGFAPWERTLAENREWLWVVRLNRAVLARWRLNGAVVAPPRILDGDLLVPARDGTLYVLSRQGGGVRRRLRTESLGGLPAPIVWDRERLYAVVQEGRVYAYARRSYRQVWNRVLGAAVYAPAALDGDGRLFVATEAGELWALRARDGDVLWRFRAEGPLRAAPLTRGDRVYVASLAGHLHALEAPTGREVWRFEARAPLEAPPAAGPGGALYLADTWRYAYALEADTGRLRWRAAVGGAAAPPVVAGNTLFLALIDRAVKRLRLTDGRVLRTYPLPATLCAPPLVHGGLLYQAAKDGRLRVYRVADGERLWEYTARGQLLAPPLIAGGRLYLADTSGEVVALAP